jgi:hypothetical protein
MKKIIITFTLILPGFCFGQNTPDTAYIFWSKSRRLQESDFQIKAAHVANTYSFGQFSFDYKIGSVFGLPKDYKKKIRNYFIRSASWIDTTYDVSTSLNYQQTLFDLAEVYVRRFRKQVYENRKKIIWGKLNINELNVQTMTEFSKRRVLYDTDTHFGTKADRQKEWEIEIEKELDALKEFSAD